jgi:hypothetical protein
MIRPVGFHRINIPGPIDDFMYPTEATPYWHVTGRHLTGSRLASSSPFLLECRV